MRKEGKRGKLMEISWVYMFMGTIIHSSEFSVENVGLEKMQLMPRITAYFAMLIFIYIIY